MTRLTASRRGPPPLPPKGGPRRRHGRSEKPSFLNDASGLTNLELGLPDALPLYLCASQ